ncbi:MAG: SMP-30/gluconolactonase/LRE family protein [Alphaproteobacteria bacterium]|nr:SMP-30/gluconolactonase/LRE family protein [Alphaproteobacteria bacterium]
MLRLVLILLALFVAAAAGFLLFWPIPIDPVAVEVERSPGFIGPYARNESLRSVAWLGTTVGKGPEDVAIRNGYAYTGLENGNIVRVRLDGSGGYEEFVNTQGRPLGMQFDQYGNLIVCDAKKGLLAILPNGQIQVLADRLNGQPFKFLDDLDIAKDGTIYFSDASQRFGLDDYFLDIMEGSATGRLLSLDPRTMQVTVRAEGLNFANGVALGPDEEYVLVDETGAARIARIWLKGTKAGQRDIFAANLPGYPDNLSYDGKGVFWVALPSPRDEQLDRLLPSPSMRRILYRLMSIGLMAQPQPPKYGFVIALDRDGHVVANLQDPTGNTISNITSVNASNGNLYFGSLETDRIATLPNPIPPPPN